MDSSKKPERQNPRQGANPLSQLIFAWILPLLFRGSRRGLSPDDLTKCMEKDESETLGDKLEEAWEKEVEISKRKGRQPKLRRALFSIFYTSCILDGLLTFIFVLINEIFLSHFRSDNTMDQQNRTTESDKSNKRIRGKLDDLINRLDLDTIQRLLSVLKEYSNVEIIDSLNETLKNPVKRITIHTQPTLPPPPPPENDEDAGKLVRLANNKIIPMSEYRTMLHQNQQPVPAKKVAPSTPSQTPSRQCVRERESATMLVILQSGEQRLIKFTLPKKSFIVQELLEQVIVPFTADSNIQCISNPGADIDYVVTVGMSNADSTELLTAAENMLNNQQQQLLAVVENTLKRMQAVQPAAAAQQTTTKQQAKSPEPPAKQDPKYVRGLLAVCSYCGCSSFVHSRCQRCMTPLANKYKTVPTSSQQQPGTPGVAKGKASDQLCKAKLELKRQQVAEMVNKGIVGVTVNTEKGRDQSPDTDTIQSLISVLKEHRAVETIELLNKILKNPAKRPNLDSSASLEPILNDLKTSLTNISSRLTGMERKMIIPVVDEKPIILNDGQAVSKAIFEAVGKHIQTTQPRFDLDSVIHRGTRLMLVVLRGGRHESSKLFLCPSQKKIGELLQYFQIHGEVSPETIHVLTAVPCESIDWICFIDLPGEIIMLDKPTSTS